MKTKSVTAGLLTAALLIKRDSAKSFMPLNLFEDILNLVESLFVYYIKLYILRDF